MAEIPGEIQAAGVVTPAPNPELHRIAYQESPDRGAARPGTDGAPKPVELTPGRHTYDLPDGRSYDVYVPKDLHYPAYVAIGADGVTKEDKQPWYQMGVLNGMYKEADEDKNHVVVTLNPVQKWSPLFGATGTYKGWNFPHGATGFVADGPNDTKYFFDMLRDLPSHVNVDLSKTLCEGPSTGGQFLLSVNEQRPELPQQAPCKTLAMFSSGQNEDEPPIKPGVSEVFVFPKDSGEKPNGGLDLTTGGGRTAALFDFFEWSARLWHNVPEKLWTTALQVNPSDPSMTTAAHGVVYDKTRVVAGNGAVLERIDVHPPYTGHYVPGAPAAAAGNPTPDNVLSGHHVAACMAGFGNHCESDADLTK
jgi:hypothetical protein